MARRARSAPVSQVPHTQVLKNYAWYLHPLGATAVDALAYLPAYNEAIRARTVKDGFKLLSQCSGELMGSAEDALNIVPPDAATCQWVVDELTRRQPAQREVWEEEIAFREESMGNNDYQGKERLLFAETIRQLKHRLATIDQGIPSAARLQRFFVKEYTMRLGMNVSADVRTALEKVAVEKQWAEIGDELMREEVAALKGAAKSVKEKATVAA